MSRSLLASLDEQFERAVLERRGFGRPLEARLCGRAVGGTAHRLRVVHVSADGLQRAPGGAVDVRKVGGRAVGGADRLAYALGVAHSAAAVRGVRPRLRHRHEPGEEPLEIAVADVLREQARAELLQLVVVAPGDAESPSRIRELRLDVRCMTRLPGSLCTREREQHSVQAREPERRDRDGDGESAVVAVAEAQQWEHVLSLRTADSDLAIEPHQRVNARATARLARSDPVSAAGVGNRVAEGESGAVLEWLIALADDADDRAAVATDVRDVLWHGHALDAAAAVDDSLQRVLLHHPAKASGGDHRLGAPRRARIDGTDGVAPSDVRAEPERRAGGIETEGRLLSLHLYSSSSGRDWRVVGDCDEALRLLKDREADVSCQPSPEPEGGDLVAAHRLVPEAQLDDVRQQLRD